MKRRIQSVDKYGTVVDDEIRKETSRQIPVTTVSESNPVNKTDVNDGWYGIGTFGKVGPCDSLMQARIRSGI